MRPKINSIKKVICQHTDFLRETYHVKEIGVFGSVVRAESTRSSDIDLLVEFSQPIDLFKFIELEEFLGKILNNRVDLVTKKALKPAIKEEILKETVYV